MDAPRTWSWPEVRALGGEPWRGDIHCVTTWSKLDTSFTGISLDALLGQVSLRPEASHVMAHSTTGYTTNLPLEDVTGAKAWLVWEHEGRPLAAEHGGPVRLLVPHLYFWRSAKWIAGLRALDHDERPPPEGTRREWQRATVVEIRRETPRAVTLRLELPHWVPHTPGQHYVVRLTAPDGYAAQRSYSVASPPRTDPSSS